MRHIHCWLHPDSGLHYTSPDTSTDPPTHPLIQPTTPSLILPPPAVCHDILRTRALRENGNHPSLRATTQKECTTGSANGRLPKMLCHTKSKQTQDLNPKASHASDSKVKGIFALPAEIFDQILRSLGPRSIASLHRTCRAMAANLPLDQRYWRTSLLSNTLLGFTWDLDHEMAQDDVLCHRNNDEALSWDWRKLARALATNGHLEIDRKSAQGTHHGLEARRRIWKCITEIAKSSSKSCASDE